MVKRGILITEIIIFLSFTALFYSYLDFTKGITGNSVSENIADFYTSIPFTSRIFVFFYFIILFVVLVYLFFKKRGDEKIAEKIPDLKKFSSSNKSNTDLDSLYELLKNKKTLNLTAVSKIFKITEETAMGWFKILESGALANIDYPGFGKPRITLIENEEEKGKEDKERVDKEIENEEEKGKEDKKREDKIIEQNKGKEIEKNREEKIEKNIDPFNIKTKLDFLNKTSRR